VAGNGSGRDRSAPAGSEQLGCSTDDPLAELVSVEARPPSESGETVCVSAIQAWEVIVLILITGATGQLGAAVVRQLLARTDGSNIAVLARDPERAAGLAQRGVSVRVGQYGDTDSLARAVEGVVDRVLLIASNELERRTQQHQNVIDAAQAAGVELLGFTSRSLNDMEGSQNAVMRDYFETETSIRESGVPAVIFRNALYLDTLSFSLGGPAVFDAGIRVPAAQGGVAYALRREMGEATANAMLDAPSGHRTYVLAAPHAYTFDDVAEALSEISGSTVTYTSVGDDDFVADAIDRGVPEPMARHLAGFFADVRDNQLDETSTDLESLLGRAPASPKDGLAELFTPAASI
jgi:NAD(P)H dehydrogenase (quinone)